MLNAIAILASDHPDVADGATASFALERVQLDAEIVSGLLFGVKAGERVHLLRHPFLP